jgi:hypothetical protein
MTTSTLADWDRAYALRVVSGVNALREYFGLSIPGLRERLVEAGWPVSVETLNGILSARKRRSFSVGEILCFARAFDVPPEFVLLGLPSSDDLPGPPLLDHPSVADTLRWMQGRNNSVYVGSPLSVLERYARILAELRRQNAVWEISGKEPRDERPGPPGTRQSRVATLIDELVSHLEYWLDCISSGILVPDLPDVPASLAPFMTGDGNRPLAPISGLVDDDLRDIVRRDFERLAAAQSDIDRMRSHDGTAADPAE